MAYVNLTPLTVIQESQDAMQMKIWDASTWNGESAITTAATVSISYYDTLGVLHTFDDYELIVGVDKTRYNEFLDHSDGHVIELADLTVGGAAPPTRFPDGHYVITTKFTDGTYAVGSEPNYVNHQAFLAKSRFMGRKLGIAILAWPLTDAVKAQNMDVFAFRMYLDAAEDAVDNAKNTEFQTFITLLTEILTYYAIEECW